MGEGNNFLLCTAKPKTATARERKGGDAMINNGIPHTLGAGAKARSAEPCERLLAASLGGRAAWPTGRLLAVVRQGAERGRAAWPRPRRHLADKELTRSRLDVCQKRCEHRPIASTNLEILHFFLFFRPAGKENYAEFSSDFYIQTRFFSRASGSCLADAKRKHSTASRTGFFPEAEAHKTAFACAQAKADLRAKKENKPIYTPFGPAPLF